MIVPTGHEFLLMTALAGQLEGQGVETQLKSSILEHVAIYMCFTVQVESIFEACDDDS